MTTNTITTEPSPGQEPQQPPGRTGMTWADIIRGLSDVLADESEDAVQRVWQRSRILDAIEMLKANTTSASVPVVVAERLAAEERQKGADAWPEPITDRTPTKRDGDSQNQVQYLLPTGHWFVGGWLHVKTLKAPWYHTPLWSPPAPTKREQAIAALRERLNNFKLHPCDSNAMELAIQALEEAGDE